MQRRWLTDRIVLSTLVILLLVVWVLSLRFGAIAISGSDILLSIRQHILQEESDLTGRIFFDIRFPRALECLVVGASLAMSGVLMQALFRNPIVEPGLIGTSSGAAFGASIYFVLGATLHFPPGEWGLPVAACTGGAVATLLVFVLSRNRQSGKSSVISLLLTGIAINALFLSGVGFSSYIARDPQARSITFWNLGTLSGASWSSVMVIGITTVLCALAALRYTRQLNALMMGEEEARLLGVDIRRLQWTVMGINVLLVAVATAFVGVISFVGLIVPHLLRMTRGSDNRFLLISSALLGAIVVTLADLVARLVLAPAELPIGVVLSLVGVPVFIVLLRRTQTYF
ncbi:MAG: iron ABC transporter permease [Cyclobacteriaceae bacterium]